MGGGREMGVVSERGREGGEHKQGSKKTEKLGRTAPELEFRVR